MAAPFIATHALAASLHTHDVPIIPDMRDADDAAADPRRIPGACAVKPPCLTEGPAPPLTGRLRRLGDAAVALDLIDDWLARPVVAA